MQVERERKKYDENVGILASNWTFKYRFIALDILMLNSLCNDIVWLKYIFFWGKLPRNLENNN